MPNKNTNSSKNKTTTTTKKSTNNTSAISLLDQLGFWAVLALAFVMIINVIINFLGLFDVSVPALTQLTGILNKIAMAIAIGITIFCSYFAARKKSKNLYTLWIVCAVLVGLCFILGISLF